MYDGLVRFFLTGRDEQNREKREIEKKCTIHYPVVLYDFMGVLSNIKAFIHAVDNQ